MVNIRTVGDLVAELLKHPQDKPFVVVECMANEVMTIDSIEDNDAVLAGAAPDGEEMHDEPLRPGVVEMLVDWP